MEHKKEEMTEEELDKWYDAYWSKRLKWTWLNRWYQFTLLCDFSGIATNHPYGGFLSSSTKDTSSREGIFSSNGLHTNFGCWFKQTTNQPS